MFRMVALFVSIKKPNPAPIPGGKGAILQCPPTYVFVPERKEHFPYSMDEGKFVQFEQDYDGRIRIRILDEIFIMDDALGFILGWLGIL